MSEPADAPRAAQQQTSPREEILLGRYRVLARRGTGGFGTVCTCWDLRLQRRVAIKRLPILDDAATTTADEALAEARTACMLGHPNIVTVFDFESDGAYAYIVMEYVDGLNLAELLARVEGGRLTCEECAQVLDSVARALEFAHENRVLHLDIKPTNIMIDRQGVVK
ncbi:TPA: serine/threonine protein kinase, partial [Clostridioides difficile]|nr:serine/threonine protein kinase [Clostridioides difficile]